MKKTIFLLFISLFACQENQVITIDKNVTMEIPSHLKSCKNLNENAFLQFQNLEKEWYIIALKANESIVINQLNIDKSIDKKNILLQYVSYLKTNYKSLAKASVIEVKVVKGLGCFASVLVERGELKIGD